MLLPGVSETSEQTQQLVDQEVHRIVDAAHGEVIDLLRAHRSQLDDLVEALFKHETLDETDAYAAAGILREPSAPANAGDQRQWPDRRRRHAERGVGYPRRRRLTRLVPEAGHLGECLVALHHPLLDRV